MSRSSGFFQSLRMLIRVYCGVHPDGENEDGPAPRTAVVMGAQVLPGGKPSPTLGARTRHAARLYKAGEVDCLIPTGGIGDHPPREAELMMEILRDAGVPDTAVVSEDTAVNTWESAFRVAEIACKIGVVEVRVVTDPLHCVRTVEVFQEAGLVGWAEPVYSSPMWQKPWSRLGQLAREAVALAWYRIRYRVGSRFQR